MVWKSRSPPEALLDVRLEAVGVGVEALAPGLLLGELGGEERRRRPDLVGGDDAPHQLEQRELARERARLHQVRHDGDVGGGLALAVGHRAHAVPDVDAEVPQSGDPAGQALVEERVVRARHQHGDVDVGGGVELRPAVAADGEQGQLVERVALARPEPLEHPVDDGAAPGEELGGRCPGLEAFVDALGAERERLAPDVGALGGGVDQRVDVGDEPAHHRRVEPRRGDAGAGRGPPVRRKVVHRPIAPRPVTARGRRCPP